MFFLLHNQGGIICLPGKKRSPLILDWLDWARRPKGSNPHPLKTRDANSNHNIANICFALPKHWFETHLKLGFWAASFSTLPTVKNLSFCGMFCGYWPTICIFIVTGSWHMNTDYLFSLKDMRPTPASLHCFCKCEDRFFVLNYCCFIYFQSVEPSFVKTGFDTHCVPKAIYTSWVMKRGCFNGYL